MDLAVREMKIEEVGLIIDCFHQSSPEHLLALGVDRARLPDPVRWRERYASQYGLPVEKRKTFLVLWASDGQPIGFSTADRIIHRQEAFIHLHILSADQRKKGRGTACLRDTIRIYFEALALQRIFCEPNAFNVAPNRTLQSVGFKYVKRTKRSRGRSTFTNP
jgi:RimJ/RimL family protein N-acetyltransferase